MTRKDLQCVHEPFGDAYYFGPERIGYRYEGPKNEEARQESGYANSTYRSIFDTIAKDNAEVCTPSVPISPKCPTPSTLVACQIEACTGRLSRLATCAILRVCRGFAGPKVVTLRFTIRVGNHVLISRRASAPSSRTWHSTGFLL